MVGEAVGVPGVGVREGVGVRVRVGVGEAVKVGVIEGVSVAVCVGVIDGVGVRNISPRRLGMLQERRKSQSQASVRRRGMPFLRGRIITLFTNYIIQAKRLT